MFGIWFDNDAWEKPKTYIFKAMISQSGYEYNISILKLNVTIIFEWVNDKKLVFIAIWKNPLNNYLFGE